MNPIQPVNQQLSGVAPTQTSQPSAPAASASGAASSSSVSFESLNVTMVQTQVSSMLSSIGGGVENNQMLKMMIGLMILQALLAEDGGNQQAGAGALLGMLGGSGSNLQSQFISMQSATNVVQIEQQSTTLETNQAALAPTATEGDAEYKGSNVDISA